VSAADPLVLLDNLATGARALVRALRAADEHALHALVSLGFLPGARVEVLRRLPVLCVRLDGACFAVDRELARGILVEAQETPPPRRRHDGAS